MIVTNEEAAIIWAKGTQRQKNLAFKVILKNNAGAIYSAGNALKLPNFHENYLDDWRQFAALFALDALDTFDPTRGTPFLKWFAFRLRAAQNAFCRAYPLVKKRVYDPKLVEVVSLNSQTRSTRDQEYLELLPAPEEEKKERFLKTMVSVLNPTEKAIIEQYFSEFYPSMGDVGERLGIGRERVRQIKDNALDKIRRSFSRPGIFSEIKRFYA